MYISRLELVALDRGIASANQYMDTNVFCVARDRGRRRLIGSADGMSQARLCIDRCIYHIGLYRIDIGIAYRIGIVLDIAGQYVVGGLARDGGIGAFMGE